MGLSNANVLKSSQIRAQWPRSVMHRNQRYQLDMYANDLSQADLLSILFDYFTFWIFCLFPAARSEWSSSVILRSDPWDIDTRRRRRFGGYVFDPHIGPRQKLSLSAHLRGLPADAFEPTSLHQCFDYDANDDDRQFSKTTRSFRIILRQEVDGLYFEASLSKWLLTCSFIAEFH